MPMPSLQLNPQNLQALNGLDPTWGRQAWQWRNRADQLDQTTLEDVIRAAAHEKAMDPLRLRKQEADIESVLAGTEGTKASTEFTKSKTAQQDMENEVYGATKADRIKTEGRKLIMEASDADLKVLENQVYTALQSRDPKERQTAQAILPHLKFAVQERFKTDQQLRVQGSANANAKSMQEARFKHEKEMKDAEIAAGKYTKKSDVAASNILDAVKAGRFTYEKAATSFEVLAAMEEDEVKKALYANLAAKFGAEALKKEGAKPGAPALGEFTNIPTNPAPQTGLGGTPPANPTTASRPDRQALQGIPEGAIEMLKKNPALAEAFDAKYGKGKAQFILGK